MRDAFLQFRAASKMVDKLREMLTEAEQDLARCETEYMEQIDIDAVVEGMLVQAFPDDPGRPTNTLRDLLLWIPKSERQGERNHE